MRLIIIVHMTITILCAMLSQSAVWCVQKYAYQIKRRLVDEAQLPDSTAHLENMVSAFVSPPDSRCTCLLHALLCVLKDSWLVSLAVSKQSL